MSQSAFFAFVDLFRYSKYCCTETRCPFPSLPFPPKGGWVGGRRARNERTIILICIFSKHMRVPRGNLWVRAGVGGWVCGEGSFFGGCCMCMHVHVCLWMCLASRLFMDRCCALCPSSLVLLSVCPLSPLPSCMTCYLNYLCYPCVVPCQSGRGRGGGGGGWP